MSFIFEEREADSPFVERIWRTRSGDFSSFVSQAATNWEIVITRQQGKQYVSVRGPETKALAAPVPEDAEFFGIRFKLGTFMPHLPAGTLVNAGADLPLASSKSFWLHGSAWQFPDYENADTFVNRLVRGGLLVREPVVEAALQGHFKDLSLRSIQRRFLKVTGLSYQTIAQIERARLALSLLQQGVPILDTVEQAGYSDQPHLTRALKLFMGQTPAQILRASKIE